MIGVTNVAPLGVHLPPAKEAPRPPSIGDLFTGVHVDSGGLV